MIKFTIDYKQVLANMKKAQKQTDSIEDRALLKWSLNVRQEARRSIKVVAPTPRQILLLRDDGRTARQRARLLKTIRERRSRVSTPGSPPYSHTRDKTRSIRNIVSVRAGSRYNKTRRVQPVALHSAAGNNVPETLEFGGTMRIVEFRWRGAESWTQKYGRRKLHPGQDRRVRLARVAARPFLNPALRKHLKAGEAILAQMMRRYTGG